jgi:hypothetical protein
MPNGFHGSKGEWARLTAPLEVLDPALEAFAQEHGFELSRNARNWPERSVRWGTPVGRLIEIFLADEERLTWNLGICAYESKAEGQHWKRRAILKGVPIEEIAQNLPRLLRDAHALVTSWSSEDLDLA